MMNDNDKSQMIEWLETKIKYANKILNEFSENMTADPAYALAWSDKSFFAAAEIDIYKRILQWISKDETTLNQIIELCHDEIIRGALYPHNSTSPASNLMATCRLQAWGEIYQKLKRYLDIKGED